LLHADATANRTAVLQATSVHTVSELAADRGAESRPRLDRERDELPRQGIGILHMLHLTAVIRAACQTFELDWALDVIGQMWEPCFQSPLRHGRMLRYLLHSSRARLLLNRYVTLGRHGDPAVAVREDHRALRGLKHLPIDNLTVNLDARVAYLRGDKAAAILMSRQSIEQFSAKGLLEEAAREKHALGFLLAGDEGAQLRAAAVAESQVLGIVNPLAALRASHPELVIDAGL